MEVSGQSCLSGGGLPRLHYLCSRNHCEYSRFALHHLSSNVITTAIDETDTVIIAPEYAEYAEYAGHVECAGTRELR